MSFSPIAQKKKDENIGVFLRIRPLNNKEIKSKEKYAIQIHPEGLKINGDDLEGDVSSTIEKHRKSKFVYDKLFGPDETTDTIFGENLEEIVVSTLKGFNSTVFVYGQTGSGKTHTLMGQYKDFINTADQISKVPKEQGIFDNPQEEQSPETKEFAVEQEYQSPFGAQSKWIYTLRIN